VQALLGLRRHGATLSVSPCIPTVWEHYSVEWTIGRTRYHFTVSNPEHRSERIRSAELDGVEVDPGAIPLEDDGLQHDVTIVLGTVQGIDTSVAAAGPAEHRQRS